MQIQNIYMLENFDLKQINEINLVFKNQKIEFSAQKLSQQISKCSNLKFLTIDLRSNQIDSQIALELGQGISKCEGLNSININLSGNSIEQKGALGLIYGISRCKSLESLVLDLYGNQIEQQGAASLGEYIKKLENLNSLTLDLRGNLIGDQGLEKLGNDLAECLKISSLILYLQTSKISNIGAHSLAFGISNYQNIQILNINLQNNQINDQGLISIAESLSNLYSLVNLSLMIQGNQYTQDGIKWLSAGITRCKNLESLSLDFIILTAQDMFSLQSIDKFDECEKQDDQFLLSSLKRLNKLDITIKDDQFQITNESVQLLGQELSKLINLSQLILEIQFSALIEQGAQELFITLQGLINLTSLSIKIYENDLIDINFTNLPILLSSCNKIKYLKLDLSFQDSKFLYCVEDGLLHLNSLVSIYLILSTSQKEVITSLMQCLNHKKDLQNIVLMNSLRTVMIDRIQKQKQIQKLLKLKKLVYSKLSF
ncbi:kinase domain protein (macronuclear) [Tetrahymena thermophila SB210]|uniref:Kinase domain protein n=1 Tax=Tetrahymena thermophila (strain SB210) TaxID=312017 RepID=W7X7J6_TETTS|nr:kinase domain protein [Tetrahymena thermophila SB210]EWS72358.1 kinase domain protein [Tetrahymena thermophila SB210]|eukprot:XP_012655106.1 kinase domain protein [Tetrahymena thermophila SB210]